MNESPLQRLLRLKKEKEQANDNASSTSSNQSQETPALETVPGSSSSPESSIGIEGSGISSSEGRVVLSEKETSTERNILLDDDNSDINSVNVESSEVIPEVPPKPMSAIERLRALKSGGVKQDVRSNTTLDTAANNSTSNMGACDTSVHAVVPEVLPKPRKTHPIAMEMAELEEALNAHVPGFVSILSTIHKKLRADPDVVTLLDDDEIAVIVAGLEKHTNVTIVAPGAVKAAKAKARKEPVSAMDL